MRNPHPDAAANFPLGVSRSSLSPVRFPIASRRQRAALSDLQTTMHPYTIGVLLCAAIVASAQGAQINTRRYRQIPSIWRSSSDAKATRSGSSKTKDRELEENLSMNVVIEEAEFSIPLVEAEFSIPLVEAEFSIPLVEAEFSMPLVLEEAEFSMPLELAEMSMPSSTEDEAGPFDSATVNLGNPRKSKLAGAAGAAAGAGLLVAFAAGGFLNVRRKRNEEIDNEEDVSVDEEDQRHELPLGISELGDDCESLEEAGTLWVDTSV